MSKKALIFKHLSALGLGSVEKPLRDNGFSIHIIECHQDNYSDIHPLEHDIAISLGGVMGAYDIKEFPFLSLELKYMRRRIEADKPLLGICLGAQMIAAAMEEKVYPASPG